MGGQVGRLRGLPGGRPVTTPRWYLSAAAVREYLAIAGYVDDDGGPAWGRAERELAEHGAVAHLVSEDHARQRQLWRTGRVQVGQRRTRLELTVSTTPRPEGDFDQLIHVRDKERRQ